MQVDSRVLAAVAILVIIIAAAAFMMRGGEEQAPAGENATGQGQQQGQQQETPATGATGAGQGGQQEEQQATGGQQQEEQAGAATGGEAQAPAETGAGEEGIILRVLTRHPGDIQLVTKELFLNSDVAKQYNIVDIHFISQDPAAWVPTIKNRNDIDVAWGGGPTLFDELYLQGLLAPLEGEGLEDAVSQVPDVYAGSPLKRIGDDGKVYWVAASIASFGFTVNHDMLQLYGLPVPKSWRDLGSPEFGTPLITVGQPAVGVANPVASTSNTRMYEIILQRYGWDEGWIILTSMAANSRIYPGSGDVRDAVIRGDIAVGITIDFYGYTAQMQNPACEYILPEGESIVNGDPIALLVTSKHVEAAKAFIRWVLTEGQAVWLDPEINRIPSNPAIFQTPEGQKRQDLKQVYEKLAQVTVIQFNDTLALMYEDAMRFYFDAVLVKNHDLLQRAWTLLLQKYYNGEIDDATLQYYIRELGKPLTYTDPVTGDTVTFTLDDAMRVNSILRDDRTLISSYQTAWSQAASERFQSIIQELGG